MKTFLLFFCFLSVAFSDNGCETGWVATLNGKQYKLAAFEVNSPNVATYYSYNTPDKSSSNSGLEDNNSGKGLIILVRTNDGNNHLVVIYDKPSDGSGGSAVTTVTRTSDLAGSTFEVKDDPGDSYSVTPALFTSNHHWDPCCTDGFALGPIPDFACFNVTIGDTTLINTVRLASAVYMDGTAVEVPKTDSQHIQIDICNTQICIPPPVGCGAFDLCQEVLSLPEGETSSWKNYDVIVINNFTANTGDVQGRLAVGNDFQVGAGFSVGDQLTTPNATYSLVVGGNANWTSGRLFPDSLSGPAENVEYAFVGDKFTAPPDLQDRRTKNCSQPGCLQSTFETAQQCYSTISQSYCGQPDYNVQYEFKYSGLFITCIDSSLQKTNIINLNASDFSKFTYTSTDNCKIGANWIINIHIPAGTFANISGDVWPTAAGTAVYNFCHDNEAPGQGCYPNVVTLQNAINGNILGPHTAFYQPSGVIIGRMIACNYEGKQSQFNRPCSPLPIFIQGAVDAAAGGKRSGDSLVPVVTYGSVIAGDHVQFDGVAGTYLVLGRVSEGGQEYLRIQGSIPDLTPGQRFKVSLAPPFGQRSNLNYDIIQNQDGECIEGQPCNSAGHLFLSFFHLLLVVVAFWF
jgi:choice-of-anchor A domain-containing protein